MKIISAVLFSMVAAACGPAERGDGGPGDPNDPNDPNDPGPSMPEQCNKMDILFVVDDSGSMAEEQSNLASNFPMFAQLLSNYTTPAGDHIDYRVAVTTTGRDMDYTISNGPLTIPTHEDGDNGAFKNNCGLSKRFLEPTDANMGSTLACRANVGTSGPGFEMPLLMSKWALSERIMDGTNAGFLRDDALLGIVYLTDENDASTDTNNWTITISGGEPAPNWNPADQVMFLDALKGHRSKWAAGVIAGDGNCSSGFGDAVDAARLKEFVTQANSGGSTQATFSSICGGDLTASLQTILATFQNACGNIIL
jgi:hypothetical protein